MKWKEREENKYPEIILSDCQIVNVEMKGGDIVVDFSKYGFVKKDCDSNKYYRTNAAQIVIEQCDMDNLAIKEIRTQQLSEEMFFDSIYDVEPKDFCENINTGKWKFEVVEEFYSTKRALYIGQIRGNEKNFWCCVKLQFKNLVYLWNDIRYDCPF